MTDDMSSDTENDEAFHEPPQAADGVSQEGKAIVRCPVSDSGGPERSFDPSLVTQHSYLGEVTDLHCELQLLEEGRDYSVPFVSPSGTCS